MALWLVRTGRHGEHEQRFFDTDRIYLTWHGLKCDLSGLQEPEDFQAVQRETYPNQSPKAVSQYAGQVRRFVIDMQPGDWVIVPGKNKSVINVAEITGPYTYTADMDDPYRHSRQVKWVGRDISRSRFDKDLLYSFGAFSTICRIERNDAEKRVREMAQKGWMSQLSPGPVIADSAGEEGEAVVDLEQLARDEIAKLIVQKFKGHGLARLVEAILIAQGYTTYLSPEGPDKGIDILAAPGSLGFGQPRVCVQVKSGDAPESTKTLNELIGAMQNVHAEQGLLVSWGGFKSSVDKELPAQFFRVRLWDQDALIGELLANYDKISPAFRAELPLKRIWTVAIPDSED